MTTAPHDTRRSVTDYLDRMARAARRQGRPAWRAHRTAAAIADATGMTSEQTRAVLLMMALESTVQEHNPEPGTPRRHFTYSLVQP